MSDRVTLCLRTLHEPRRPEEVVARWLALAAALVQWPGAPVVVERRLVTPGPDALVAELLVLTAHGAGIVASRDELERDLSQLARPLVAGATCRRLRGNDGVGGAGAFPVAAAVELAPPCAGAIEGPVPGTSLRAALAILSEGCGRAAVSLVIGTPPGLVDEGLRQPVRCGLRLVADGPLPNAAVAHAAAVLGLGGGDAGRPGGAAARLEERAALLRHAAVPGAGRRDGAGVVEAEVAAMLVSLPIGAAALEPAPSPGRPGTPLGRSLSGAPVRLPWPARTAGVAVIGHERERARILARTVGEDLRCGRAVTVVAIGGRRPRWAAPAGGRSAQVVGAPGGVAGGRALLRAVERAAAPGDSVVADGCDALPAGLVRRALHRAAVRGVALTLGASSAPAAAGTVVALHGGEHSLPPTYLGGPLASGAAVVYRVGDDASLTSMRRPERRPGTVDRRPA